MVQLQSRNETLTHNYAIIEKLSTAVISSFGGERSTIMEDCACF